MDGWDRISRAALVALAVGLGWGIRGDFGHLLGAAYPGAALALAFAYVTGQDCMFRRMPILAALGAIGISLGGSMSYGILHGYAQSDTFINYAYGFFTLFLQGGTWGLFGCALIGLSLEKQPLRWTEWLTGIAVCILSGAVFRFLVVSVLGFHVNPPRGDGSIAFTGAAIGVFAWLAWARKRSGLKAAVLGMVGFGLGMSAGRLLGNIANVAQINNVMPFTINHWNVMECSVGIIGGFVFAWGMLGRDFPAPVENTRFKVLSGLSIVYVLFLIPLLHRLTRVHDKRIGEWTKRIAEFGHANPDGAVNSTLTLMTVVLGFAFVGTCVWLWLHYTNKSERAWVPVLWLSLTMVLFQNLFALFPYYPHESGRINMHVVFWVFLGLMALHVFFRTHESDTEPDGETEKSHWRRWLAIALAGYAITVLAAGMVNGEQTMKSANTRWPLWSWTDGPFPGR
ncbi:MAG: hypothetical protein RBU21_23735 [FCB group bacterium]|jgi:hypothetical protein|nr:hypothetical protein [FCB group bacterium]